MWVIGLSEFTLLNTHKIHGFCLWQSCSQRYPCEKKPSPAVGSGCHCEGELWLSPSWNKEARFRNRGIGMPQKQASKQDQTGRYCQVWGVEPFTELSRLQNVDDIGNLQLQAGHHPDKGQKSEGMKYKLVQEPNQHLLHRSSRFFGSKNWKTRGGIGNQI